MAKLGKTKLRSKRVKVKAVPAAKKRLSGRELKKVKGWLAVDPSDPSGNTVYAFGTPKSGKQLITATGHGSGPPVK